jgi:hypothetical protein
MKPNIYAAITVALVACSDPAVVPGPRFANAPAVKEVSDRRNIPEPKARDTRPQLYMFDGSFTRPLTHPFELEKKRRALGVNSLDEVPDSSWFTNRIGVRDVTLEEMRSGPNVIGNPEAHVPWKVIRKKSSGEAAGLLIRDARGEEFIIKFDRVGNHEMESAAQIIAGRLLWACGYNVTDDYIARVRVGDLVVGEDAYTANHVERHPFREGDLMEMLEEVEHEPDGRLRVMASHIVPGKILGGHSNEGRRADDPNDVIPHERRRDLRGTRAIFAWLDHMDLKQDNTLDVWAEDPAAPGTHYVKHYFLDYGKALGVMPYGNHDARRGFEYAFDIAPTWGSLVTFGLWSRPYEARTLPAYRGIGMYDARTYDPAHWRAQTPSYLPVLNADRVDWFWGAKIVMRFTKEQLRAAVEAGQLTDPAAANYLVDTLVARQRATAEYAFSRVSPLDNFFMQANGSLCFDDLVRTYGLSDRETHYRFRTYSRSTRPLGVERDIKAASMARVCTRPLELSSARDGYTIVRLDTRRGETAHAVFVHVAREPVEGRWNVIGIWRE